jgi:ABC-type polar amino acid transport system ATPase subunit
MRSIFLEVNSSARPLRALATDLDLILFDEPTSALDPELVGGRGEADEGPRVAGMTMITVTHEIDFARDVSGAVVFIERGAVVESGRTRNFLGRFFRDRQRVHR